MAKQPQKFDWLMKSLWGHGISKEQAAQFEDRLAHDPSDREARAALIGYYSSGRTKTKAAARSRVKHILWVLENVPECGLGTTPYLRIAKTDHPEDYERAKEILLRQCKIFSKSKDAKVLMDLGSVFRYEEPDITIRLLREAHAISDKAKKAHVAFWLSTALHQLGQQNDDLNSLREAVEFMQEYVAAQEPDRKFDTRFWLAKLAFDSEQFDLARDVSTEMLSEKPEDNQAVHVAHTVLGSIAFREKNMASAAEHLRLAGRVGESPRLGSYGPMMELAQNLLATGERDAVIQYLNDCRKFWKMGKRKLPQWIRKIEAGENPELRGDSL